MPSSASAPTRLYTLSLHDALPISGSMPGSDFASEPLTIRMLAASITVFLPSFSTFTRPGPSYLPQPCTQSTLFFLKRNSIPLECFRSEEHTSELQSLRHLVCRLLLPPPPGSTLFPYTTLFRSRVQCQGAISLLNHSPSGCWQPQSRFSCRPSLRLRARGLHTFPSLAPSPPCSS